ncbi:MAG: response regulator transcription factor [Gammaproteobacteria bacterium]
MTTDKTFMVVDDSKVTRMMVSAMVKASRPDWTILEAPDGNIALSLVNEHPVDLFSIDLNMPDMDGLELIEKLNSQLPEAKKALLTANIQQSTHEKSRLLGARCINKPITDETINAMLEYFNE